MKKVLSLLLSVVMVVSVFVTMPFSAGAASSKTLYCNNDLLKQVGKQISGGYACACYALAYCRTMLDGKVHHYYEYNNGIKDEYNISCQWGAGNYYTVKAGSRANAFKACYDSVNNNRPIVLHVNNSYGQHWVTVVGYQNVTNTSSMTESNLLVIDPVHGYTGSPRTLSGYTLHSDYRYATTNSGSVADPHTHNYNTYVYYEAAHPHYHWYKCSCGAVNPDYSKTTLLSTCEKCLPGKPAINVRAGSSSEYTQFYWNATTNADAYELKLYNADTNELYHHYFNIYAPQYQIKLPNGKYTIYPIATNFKLMSSDRWWTQGDGVTFTVQEGEVALTSEIIYDGNKYELFDITMPWTEAKAKCEELGGHLVTITSEEEADIVDILVDKGDRYCYWMGITDEDGVWANITEEPVTYTSWISGEPNNTYGYEHYGVIRNIDGYNWNDVVNMYGTNSIGFICEYENVEPVIMLGDVDGDKDISVMDATLIQLAISRQVTLTDVQINAADTDQDGDMNIMDATAIQLYVAKIITEF